MQLTGSIFLFKELLSFIWLIFILFYFAMAQKSQFARFLQAKDPCKPSTVCMF